MDVRTNNVNSLNGLEYSSVKASILNWKRRITNLWPSLDCTICKGTRDPEKWPPTTFDKFVTETLRCCLGRFGYNPVHRYPYSPFSSQIGAIGFVLYWTNFCLSLFGSRVFPSHWKHPDEYWKLTPRSGEDLERPRLFSHPILGCHSWRLAVLTRLPSSPLGCRASGKSRALFLSRNPSHESACSERLQLAGTSVNRYDQTTHLIQKLSPFGWGIYLTRHSVLSVCAASTDSPRLGRTHWHILAYQGYQWT